MTNEFECLQFQVSRKMWFTEGPEDLSAEKSSIPCKSKSFHLLTSSSFSFHVHYKLPGRVALQFSQPVLWMEVTSQKQPVPLALSHEGHLQFCICVVIYECFCFGPVLSLSQKVSSLPVAMTASLSNVYDEVSQWYALRMKFGFWKAKSIYALMHTPRLWEHCYEITHKN